MAHLIVGREQITLSEYFLQKLLVSQHQTETVNMTGQVLQQTCQSSKLSDYRQFLRVLHFCDHDLTTGGKTSAPHHTPSLERTFTLMQCAHVLY